MRRALSVSLLLSLVGCAGYLERRHGEPLSAPPDRFVEPQAVAMDDELRQRPRPEARPDVLEEAESPQPPVIAPPPSYAEGHAVSPAEWGTALGAPPLDALLREALTANLEVSVAVQRIRQFEALSRQARAARLPQINGQIGANYGSTIRPPFGRTDSWDVAFSLPVSYELDLFGRYAVEHQSTRFDAAAAERDAQAAAISVAAQASEAWFDLVEVRARRALLTEQLETNQTYFDLVRLRFERGLTSAVDVHQQRQLVAQTEAQLALVDAQEVVLHNQLAFLLASPPGRRFAEDFGALPDLPAPPELGVPAQILERRPDIEAAHLRLQAADRRVAGAIRAQLPSLRVAFTPGYRISGIELRGPLAEFGQDTVRGFEWTVGGTMNIPIFDGLRSPAAAQQRRSQVEETLARYEQTFLGALAEVENAIALERQQRLNIHHLVRQLEFAEDTLNAARERYRTGLSDFLPVLTALRTQQQVALGLLDARRRLISHRIQLYRALGAAWDVEAEVQSP